MILMFNVVPKILGVLQCQDTTVRDFLLKQWIMLCAEFQVQFLSRKNLRLIRLTN